MAWSNTSILAIVEIVLYLLFVPLTLFTAIRHGLRGLLSHVYLFIFIILRIVADGLAISDRNKPAGTSTAGAIVNSIGLSPLLLSTMAILNESRSYMKSKESTKSEKTRTIVLEVLMHQLVIAGLALLAVGSSRVTTATSSSDLDRDRSLAKAGAMLLLVSWIICCVWTLLNTRFCQQKGIKGSPRILLAAAVVLLPFLGARVVYAVVYAFDVSGRLSPATASFAIKLCLVFLMQLIVAIAMQAGLFLSRHISQRSQIERRGNSVVAHDRGETYELNQSALKV